MVDASGHVWSSVSGTNLAPATFPAGTTRFQSNKWASLPTSNEEVAYVASGYVSDSTCVAFQVRPSNVTPSGLYSATLLYTVVPMY